MLCRQEIRVADEAGDELAHRPEVKILAGADLFDTAFPEQGDAIRAHKFGYGLFTGFGYKATRKDCSFTGKLIAQQLTDGISMTGSPTSRSK